MKNPLLSISILIFPLLLFSCKKDTVTIFEDCRIIQTEYRDDNHIEIRPIIYDQELRPIKFTQNNSHYLTYDYSENKIIQKEFVNEKPYLTVAYRLLNNKIVEANFSEIEAAGLSKTEYKIIYAYNNQGYLIFKELTQTLSTKDDNNDDRFLVRTVIISSSSYHYINGNLDTEDRLYTINSSLLDKASLKYTYDTSKLNNLPFNQGNFIERYFSGKPNKNLVTKRVLTRSNNTTQETIYSYIFDNSQKVSSITETEDGYSRTQEFTYLCK